MFFIKNYIYAHKRSKLIALILSILSIFIDGVIKINTQVIAGLTTYSGGFPVTWFEYYYPNTIDLSLKYILSNWIGNYKLDLGVFIINSIIIYYFIKFIIIMVKKNNLTDKEYIKSIRKSLFLTTIISIAYIALLVLSFSNNRNLVSLLMIPVVGVYGYLLLKNKWPLVLIGVFALSSVLLFAQSNFYTVSLSFNIINALLFSSICVLFSLLGVLITALLQFSFRKPLKNKFSLKIGSLCITVSIIGTFLFITNLFVGNPIASLSAEKAIKAHIEQNYSSLDLEITKPSYDFKDMDYTASAKSNTSIDTDFSIHYKNGKVYDTYKSRVLNKTNTLRRLESEYSRYITPLLSTIPDLQDNTAHVQMDYTSKNIMVDMNLHNALSLGMKIEITTTSLPNSLKNIATILEISHKTLLDNRCHFLYYDLSSEYKGTLVRINDVTPTAIESGKLEELLEEAKNYKESDAQTDENVGNSKSDSVRKINVFVGSHR